YEPNLANFIAGKPFKLDCYIEKIPKNKLPTTDATDQEQAQFLYSVFEQKVRWQLHFSPCSELYSFLQDELMEMHRQYHTFPQAIVEAKRPCLWRLARFIFLNFFVSGSMIAYFIYLAITTHSLAL